MFIYVNKKQIAKLKDRLSLSTSRTKEVFKITHLERILQKHALETQANDHRREYSAEQWLKTFFLPQIKGFTKIRPFGKSCCICQLVINHSD